MSDWPYSYQPEDRVRFLIEHNTGYASAPEGYETTVLEVDGNGGAMVYLPYDGGTVRQYVPEAVLWPMEVTT